MKLGNILCRYNFPSADWNTDISIRISLVSDSILDDAYKHVLFRLDRIDKINHKNLCTAKWLTKWLKLIETEMQRRMSFKDGE
jgi:hypothetical protein